MRNWKFLKPVLQSERQIRDEMAWALLEAIEALFPAKIAELNNLNVGLNAIPQIYEGMSEEQIAFEEEEALRIFEKVRAEVEQWTTANHIDCPAVTGAALRFVCGDIGPENGMSWTYIDRTYVDEKGREQVLPFIWTYPPDEQKGEFLHRADAYYDQVVRLLAAEGEKVGPVKRNLIHFQFLAARLVGGYTPAELASDDKLRSRLNLPALSEKTIADETRKVAELIGIQLPTGRGPIPGKPRRSRMP